MKVLSLFDGISCARVALERAGIPVEIYEASEVDESAIAISKKNYPDIEQLGDVKNIIGNGDCFSGKNICINHEVDILIGGSPCQDLSIAKMNRSSAGLSGEKSSLFWEFARLKKQLRPKYFILENVASMPRVAREEISKELGVEPIMINASLVSGQNRKRLFWTNIPNVTQPEDRHIFLKDVLENGTGDLKVESVAKRNKNRSKHQHIGLNYGDFPKEYHLEPQKDGKSFCVKSATQEFMVRYGDTVRNLTPIECERLQGLPDNYTEGISKTQRHKVLGNAFNVDVVAHILSFIKN